MKSLDKVATMRYTIFMDRESRNANTTKEDIMSNGTITNVIRDETVIDDSHYDLLTVATDDGETIVKNGKNFEAGMLNVGDRVVVRAAKFHGRKIVSISAN